MTTPHQQRLPMNTFAIAFELAGLASAWTAAANALPLGGVASALWVIAAVSWVWLLIAHTVRGRRSSDPLSAQLRDPVQGPVAALVPITGMLLAGDVYRYSPTLSQILVIVFMITTAVFAGWLMSRWTKGGIPLEAIHGGYLLPTVAGGLIASIASAKVGLVTLEIGAFAVGIFFWAVMFAFILGRLAVGPAVPNPLVPTLAILVAPPAVAGTAWFLIADRVGSVGYALGGLTLAMILVQLSLIPRYRALPFAIGFWGFTFPFAAVAGYGIEWLGGVRPSSWPALIVVILTGITLLIGVIAVKSLRLLSVAPPARAEHSELQPVTATIRAGA